MFERDGHAEQVLHRQSVPILCAEELEGIARGDAGAICESDSVAVEERCGGDHADLVPELLWTVEPGVGDRPTAGRQGVLRLCGGLPT